MRVSITVFITVLLIIGAVILCGCNTAETPSAKETNTPADIPSEESHLPEAELEQDVSKLFDNEIRVALKQVFGDAKLVDAIEEDDFVYLGYVIPREVKEEDMDMLVDALKYDVEDVMPELSEIMLNKNVDGKIYDIHITIINKNVDVEISS